MAYVSETALAHRLREAGSGIVDAVEQFAEQFGDMKLAYRDHQAQLSQHQVGLSAVRTEVLARIEAMESKVLQKLDEVSRQLGMNGSGGHG